MSDKNLTTSKYPFSLAKSTAWIVIGALIECKYLIMSLFAKSLADLIRGVRAHPDDQVNSTATPV